MTAPARAVLRQPFRGDRPGVTLYALYRPGAWIDGDFPDRHLPGVVTPSSFVMDGPGWEIRLWDLTFDEFPDSASWRSGIDEVYAWVFRSGGLVAWIGDGIGYAAPPHLFDAGKMANSVFEGRSHDGVRAGTLDLDAPAVYLDAAGLAVLRAASGS
ncbi:hypothetical protein [Actinoplanes sp. NPDC026670]|uniref:hypothetical protein n=1 Tax=Actinoplanes sp. NPDC026670 TaxID=3154700 RepID=UPI0034038A25